MCMVLVFILYVDLVLMLFSVVGVDVDVVVVVLVELFFEVYLLFGCDLMLVVDGVLVDEGWVIYLMMCDNVFEGDIGVFLLLW